MSRQEIREFLADEQGAEVPEYVVIGGFFVGLVALVVMTVGRWLIAQVTGTI